MSLTTPVTLQQAPNPYEEYETFKTQAAPLLYDYYFPHKLDWPSSCCRWGAVKHQTQQYQQQEVLFGCRTDGNYIERINAWQGLGSLMVFGTVDIPAQGYKLGPKSTEAISGRRAMGSGKRFEDPNQRIEVQKVIIHPGEINCLKCWPKNKRIVATHSDNKNVYLWDIKHQKNAVDRINIDANYPDLLLEGHTDVAAYALDWHHNDPIVASGGRDRQILLWNVDQYFNTHGRIPEEEKDYSAFMRDETQVNGAGAAASMEVTTDQSMPQNSMSRIQKSLQSYLTDSKKETKFPRLEPFMRLTGHSGNIEDLVFKNDTSTCELVSVGVDRYILFWDVRSGSNKPVNKALQAHFDDINTVDWCKVDSNYVATGSNDLKVSIIDIRKLTSEVVPDKTKLCPAVVRQLIGHTASINVVRFSPHSKDLLASSGDSMIIWDLKQPDDSEDKILFKHAGHVGQIVDFEWNEFAPWSIMSASDDIDSTAIQLGACSLQLFRPLDLLVDMSESESKEALQRAAAMEMSE